MSDPKQKSDPAAPARHPLVVIINNQERLEIVQVPPECPAQVGVGIRDGMVALVPGVNIVDRVAIEWCRKNALFESKFTTKIPRHVAEEARSHREGKPMLSLGKEVPATRQLSALSAEEAVELIGDVNSTELLAALKQGESRDEVRAAIANRIDFINAGKPELDAA